MAEEKPSLHIDLDWKKQAQEEKRRLEEEAKKRADEAAAQRAAAAAAPTSPAGLPGGGAADEALAGAGGAAVTGRGRAARGSREVPEASLQTLINTLVTQALLYMGELPTSSGQTMMSLDMARLQVDTLGVLEEKTRGNLTEDEAVALDLALYDVRTRFVSVSQQVIAGAA